MEVCQLKIFLVPLVRLNHLQFFRDVTRTVAKLVLIILHRPALEFPLSGFKAGVVEKNRKWCKLDVWTLLLLYVNTVCANILFN